MDTEPLRDGDFFAVVDRKMRIVGDCTENEDGSMTGQLYRNLDDYRENRAMEPEFTYWP